jgi:biopolymer transport protein ExbD
MDMTPMIDIVFQLIIFFVVTVDMQNKALETSVRMAMAPNGPVEEVKDPRTIVVDVEADGTISIMRTPLGEGQLLAILKKAVNTSGQSTPVVIRGDLEAKHEVIKRVMDVCGKAGLWKLRFAALKEKA